MDSFRHVNNVSFADYLQEARWDFLASTGCRDLNFVVLASQRLNYVAPVTFDGNDVSVEVWVTAVGEKSFSLAYEIFRETGGDRTVFLRAYATQVAFDYRGTRQTRPLTEEERAALLARMEPTDDEPVDLSVPDRAADNSHDVTLRLSDIDLGGIVSNVKYLEFFQEARIDLFRSLAARIAAGAPMMGTVVAQADVQYVAPIRYRPEPYDCRTWVSHVGNRSIVLNAEFGDHGDVKARGRFVMVAFDVEAATAVDLDPAWRAVLTGDPA
jgi:acyl-CoA thioester hydrolase